MCFVPYTFDESWKKYEYKTSKKAIENIVSLPELGDLKEECQLVVKNKKQEYTSPLKKISVFQENKDGKQIIHLDNRKEVLRDLNIDCSAPTQGGTAKINITLARRMEFNIESLLKREECFEHMADLFKDKEETEMFVKNNSGDVILYGNKLNGNFDDDRDGIELLKKIAKVEEYFGVKFHNPYELYEKDMERANILLQLIDDGYTKKLKLGKMMTVNLSNIDMMDKWSKEISKANNFLIQYNKEFFCEIFGNIFSIGDIVILAGPYHMDKEDFEYKWKTFKEGDIRKGIMNADDNFSTYFIKNPQRLKGKVLSDIDCKVIKVNNADLNFGFIYEKK